MELSRRALSVLCAVVELHIRSGGPVASKQVARHSGLGLSPATMRNVMAELEEGGYLCRAHSSAGRVPSDRGFRHYVDALPRRSGPTPTMRREIEEQMAAMRRETAPSGSSGSRAWRVSGIRRLSCASENWASTSTD